MAKTTAPARLITAAPTLQTRVHLWGESGHTVQVVDSTFRIGRSDECDLCLADPRASGMHAQFAKKAGGTWAVRDLDSTNGTWINGTRARAAEVADGDIVRLGDTIVIVENGFVAHPSVNGSLIGAELTTEATLLARSDAPALILGPTGAGKGHFVERVAELSKRKPLLQVNCGALPANLVESELFGHTRGAFTGATQAKKGLFQAASGGTLFLDEIGTLSAELQSKLLLAVETGRIRPVGATASQDIDVRVIAATNEDLRGRMADGSFREDLYFRLSAHVVTLPRLRSRRADILPVFRGAVGEGILLTAEFSESLLLHDWPGNFRELLQVAAGLRARGKSCLDYRDLPEEFTGAIRDRSPDGFDDRGRPLESTLLAMLERHSFNVSAVARECGKMPTQVRRWMAMYGIERPG